jgi:hypothetical protein
MATGVDIDREALAWGAQHNGDALLGGSATEQLCLLHSNVSCRCLRTLLVLHLADSIARHVQGAEVGSAVRTTTCLNILAVSCRCWTT